MCLIYIEIYRLIENEYICRIYALKNICQLPHNSTVQLVLERAG